MPVATPDHAHTLSRALGSLLVSAARPLALALFVAGMLMLAPAPTAQGATTDVLVGDFWFCSAGFENGVCGTNIAVGDTVHWDFSGGVFTHTSTDCDGDCDAFPFGVEWDSGFIGANGDFSYTFNSPGVYDYYCTLHPLSMRGQVTVTGPVGGVAELAGIDPNPASPAATAEESGSLFGIGWAMGIAAAGTAAVGATLLIGRRHWLR